MGDMPASTAVAQVAQKARGAPSTCTKPARVPVLTPAHVQGDAHGRSAEALNQLTRGASTCAVSMPSARLQQLTQQAPVTPPM